MLRQFTYGFINTVKLIRFWKWIVVMPSDSVYNNELYIGIFFDCLAGDS